MDRSPRDFESRARGGASAAMEDQWCTFQYLAGVCRTAAYRLNPIVVNRTVTKPLQSPVARDGRRLAVLPRCRSRYSLQVAFQSARSCVESMMYPENWTGG